MDEFWLNSTAEITALTPIHIGTVDVLNKLNSVVKNKRLWAMDEARLMDWVGENELRAQDFIRVAEQGGSLEQFLLDKGAPVEALAAFSVALRTSDTFKDARPFIRNPDGAVYLPGSSLKGSLRSALLRGMILADGDLFSEVDDTVIALANDPNPRKRNRASDEAQAKVFVKSGVAASRYPNYDVNRTLGVRDSVPFQPGSSEIIAVGILSLQEDDSLALKQRHGVEVKVFLEALRPQTHWQMDLSRDLRFLAGLGQAGELGLDETRLRTPLVWLTEVCRHTSFDLIEQEFKFYKQHGDLRLAKWFQDQYKKLREDPALFVLPLGWGSGYDAKTITDALTEETIERIFAQEPDPRRPGAVRPVYPYLKGLGRPGNRPDSEWLGIDDSPKSRKVALLPDGTQTPVGWVMVRLVTAAQPALQDVWEQTRTDTPQPDLPQAMRRAKPVEPSAPPAPVQKTVAIVEQFNRLPEVGERFYGEVFDPGPRIVYLEIPGLSADDDAVGGIQRSLFTGAVPDRVLCEVIEVTTDPAKPGFPLILCRPVTP
jgi:CRISPR type III-A-associated RAMP protein Csm5